MTITLLYRPLFLDVEQLTHRYAEARMQAGDAKDLAQVEENPSDEALITRLLTTASAQMRHVMRDYVEKTAQDADDTLPSMEEGDGWCFCFLPHVTADGKALAELMHWYMVKVAACEWAKMFAPAETDRLQADLLTTERAIMDAVGDTGMPMKTRRDAYCDYGTEVDIDYIR